MFDAEKEQDTFVALTEGLNLFATVGGEAYARARLFQMDALDLLSPNFGTDEVKWFDVVRDAAQGRAIDRDQNDDARVSCGAIGICRV